LRYIRPGRCIFRANTRKLTDTIPWQVEASLKQSLDRTLVASIGPVCSVALRKLAVRVDIEAQPPKLGPLIEAINAALTDPRRLGKS